MTYMGIGLVWQSENVVDVRISPIPPFFLPHHLRSRHFFKEPSMPFGLQLSVYLLCSVLLFLQTGVFVCIVGFPTL